MRLSFPPHQVSQGTTALGVGVTDSIYFIGDLQINTGKELFPFATITSPFEETLSISIPSPPSSEEELIIQ